MPPAGEYYEELHHRRRSAHPKPRPAIFRQTFRTGDQYSRLGSVWIMNGAAPASSSTW
jgi:hypothetical protein